MSDEQEPEIEAPVDGAGIATKLKDLSPFDNPTMWRRQFTALAAEQAPLALISVIDLLHSRDPMARLMAAKLVLEYGMGKPVDASKHDAVNHKIIEGRDNRVRWATNMEVTDAALARAKDDAPVTLQPLLVPEAPLMTPEAAPVDAAPDDSPPDDGKDAATEQPGLIPALPIVEFSKLFGEDRGIATDGADLTSKEGA